MRILSIIFLWFLMAIGTHAGDLSVGDPAPDFEYGDVFIFL